MSSTAAVYGCLGPELLPEERRFFADVRPFGFILFARNVADPGQVAELCAALREAAADPDAPIFIDQEGGRVARLKPPHWRERTAARRFGQVYDANPES